MLIALLNQDPCAEVAFCQRCIRKFNHVSSKIIKSNLYWHQHWASSLISLCHQLISAVHCALAFNCSKCPCHYPPRVTSFQTVRDLPLRSGIFKKERVYLANATIPCATMLSQRRSWVQSHKSKAIISSLSDTSLLHRAPKIKTRTQRENMVVENFSPGAKKQT